MYRLKASSSEGLIIPYDDYAISTKGVTWGSGAPVNHQAILSTNNLKSMIMFRQSDMVASQQNGWSNSSYLYLGIQNYLTTINNNNIPANPLSSPQAILNYNMKNRSSLGNQLSNCIANNPFVFYRSECISDGGVATDVPSAICSFMIYNNYEKINEDIDVGNGLSLNTAGSCLVMKYSEDSGPGVADEATLKSSALLGATKTYTMYMLMTYGKALVLADGAIAIRG
jgi:hypothetical protein